MNTPLPTITELLATMHVISVPMRVRFRGVTMREMALFEGPRGWTEFSPFLEYGDAEASAWLAAAIAFGWGDTPPARRSQIPINATVPAVASTDVAAVLALFGAQPHTVKIKVAEPGQTLADDIARIEAVAAAAPAARLRVDANGAWSVDEAKRALDEFARFDLEYVEQPVATIAELAEVRAWSQAGPGTRIAADESVRRADDPLRVAAEGAADIVIVKAQPLGGVARALHVVEQSGLPAVVSSALDSAVGIGMGLALAAALPELPYACGLGTGGFFVDDVAPRPSGAVIAAERAAVDSAAVSRLAASPERVAWWRARVERCYAKIQPGT